jgi:hypothetical protein
MPILPRGLSVGNADCQTGDTHHELPGLAVPTL